MDFLTLQEKLKPKQCKRWNDRQRKLHALDTVRTYTFYEILRDELKDFDDRYDANEDYRPLDKRRTAAEYRLAGIITRDVVAMLFGEGKFPSILFESDKDTDGARELIRVAKLESLLNTAATQGACGAVALVPEIFDDGTTKRLYIDIWDAWECDPVFERLNPGKLHSLTRTWLVKREDLIADGYNIDALELKWHKKLEGQLAKPEDKNKIPFWYLRRQITADESLWFQPVPKAVYEKDDWDEWEKDTDTKGDDGETVPGRSVQHDLGRCNAMWIAPMSRPGSPTGPCIYDGAITNEFLVERIASVGAQAVVTAGQPILATATGNAGETGVQNDLGGNDGQPSTKENKRVGPEDIVEVSEVNGAWLVQMDAGAVTPMDALILRLRALSLENCGGSRITEESLAGAKSGYAMELLNQALTYVAGAMRPAWADAILELLLLIAFMIEKFGGTIEGLNTKLSPEAKLKSTSWGPWYELSGQDLQFFIAATAMAVEKGMIDLDTAIANVAPAYDVTDVEGLKTKIKAEMQKQADQQHQQALELKTASPKTPAAA
jgi:hypothetical protein